jgi:hypothetical protein
MMKRKILGHEPYDEAAGDVWLHGRGISSDTSTRKKM